jgi:hypothetical protein
MVIHLLALLTLGLICGSELNVGAFAHPTLNRQPLEVHIPMRSAFAVLFGKVMPFWMAVSTLLNLLVLLPFEHLPLPAWHLVATAFAIQVLMILFSLAAPVPINNRIKTWTIATLPPNWRAMEHRWNIYHWIRTSLLIAAFILLALGIAPY